MGKKHVRREVEENRKERDSKSIFYQAGSVVGSVVPAWDKPITWR